jgi:ribosomal protein S18 acetylase RimI-like enzyme
MIIREITEEDWEILRDIRLAALLDAPTAFGLSHAIAAAYSDAQWRDRASRRGQAEFILAIINGVAVGIAGHFVNPTSEFNLIAMWVKPECRGTTVAAQLVESVKMRAVSRGHARIVLSVSPDNGAAAAFYRKQGFSFLPEWETLANHPGLKAQKMECRDITCHTRFTPRTIGALPRHIPLLAMSRCAPGSAF